MSVAARLATADGPRLEIVTSEERLAAIAPAWNALWREADGLVFQSHGWISAWWRTTSGRERRNLLIGLVWNGEVLETIMPFAVNRRRGVRILEWAAKDHSDYGDLLALPGWKRDAAAALWREIARQGSFDMAYLNRLLPDAAWSVSPRGRRAASRAGDCGPRSAGTGVRPAPRRWLRP